MLSKLSFSVLPASRQEVKTDNSGNQQTHIHKSERNPNILNTQNIYCPLFGIQNIKAISDKTAPKHKLANYTGCLIGGSIGDALGWPVEFEKLNKIKRYYGINGITELELRNNKAEITDDTQMTIFTADGLLKSAVKDFNEESIPDMSIIYDSYQNWLNTQNNIYHANNNGWISNIEGLYARRAPGTTCTGALYNKKPGSIENPINSSKGCGGVMRVAPVGLMYYRNPAKAFEVGARCAALTHGSPSAYLPAGVHACIIANLVQGKTVEKAVDSSIDVLKEYEGHEDTLHLLEKAKEYAKSDMSNERAIRLLGEGWHGDEAIAISVYCALKYSDNFEKALISAVNHDGDSDSTGAITGNILGTYLGIDNIPSKWQKPIELSDELKQIAIDLYHKPEEIYDGNKRYPIS